MDPRTGKGKRSDFAAIRGVQYAAAFISQIETEGLTPDLCLERSSIGFEQSKKGQHSTNLIFSIGLEKVFRHDCTQLTVAIFQLDGTLIDNVFQGNIPLYHDTPL